MECGNISGFARTGHRKGGVGKEVYATSRQFTIMIFGSYVEKHDVS